MDRTTTHRYFFALRPPPAQVAQCAAQREAVPLIGAPVVDPRLHVTLAVIGEGQEADPALVQKARAAMRGHRFGAAPIAFDKLVIGATLALEAATKQEPLLALRAALVARLGAAGIAPLHGGFRPHMTLGYSPRGVGRRKIDPIVWTIDRIVLIESLVGQGIHREAARWSLVAVPNAPPRQYRFDFAA